MNIIHMKYAVEVARYGSINKASESLGMAQPNISRAIKDLEADLGITIFDRSAKGMNLTPEGKEFIANSQKILNQLNELKQMYSGGMQNKQKFSLSAPRAGYIADAFASFSLHIADTSAEILLDETGTYNTIKKILSSDCKLGIIRYDEDADGYFKETLDKNELVYETVAAFKYNVLVSKSSPLALLDKISENDLRDKIQITHNDPYEATLSAAEPKKGEKRGFAARCIYVLDSAAQLELLAENPETFMWVSPVPQKLLDRYNLVQKEGLEDKKTYKDVLVHRKDYKLTKLDKAFIEELNISKNNAF